MRPVISSYEAKLLYALLDAAADDGRLRRSPFETRWEAVKAQAHIFSRVDRSALYQLVEELAGVGGLDSTWMHERWLNVKARVETAPMEFPTSQAPFA